MNMDNVNKELCNLWDSNNGILKDFYITSLENAISSCQKDKHKAENEGKNTDRYNSLIQFYTNDLNDPILAPMQFGEYPDHVDILFLGINPSFNQEMEHIRETFTFSNFNEENKQRMIEYDSNTVDWEKNESNQDYFNEILRLFKKGDGFKNLEEATKVNLDLFFIRITDQQEIDKLIYARNGNRYIYQTMDNQRIRVLNRFALDQTTISLGIVAKLQPKLIVVLNAGGAQIIKDLGLIKDNEFDYKIGTYNSTLNGNLPKTPVILASQLSGGAMGVPEKERLRWHMDWILGKIK